MPRKATLAVVTFLVLISLPQLIPRFGDYRVFEWRNAVGVLEFLPRKTSASPQEEERKRLRPQAATGAALRWLVDPAGNLEHFYEALRQTEARRPGAVTRILHYGDSPTTADLITADVRQVLQSRFGNAGHGFVLPAKPWAWYEHRGVAIRAQGWLIDPATQSVLRDGFHGLGGVGFTGKPGASAEIRLRGGQTRVEISYLQQPGGGVVSLEVDGAPAGIVDTRSDAVGPGFASFQVPPEAASFALRVESGHPRVFGWRFENSGPGVVYNALGLNGAYVSIPARIMKEGHWAAQLRHHKPDLVVINYGTNESVYPNFIDTAFARELREIVRRVRAAVPGSSILIMSPMDRGTRSDTGEITTVPALHRVVDAQERVARETGCAFYNTFQAMGGVGTMGRWYAAEPRLVSADFIHPMPAGARMVGNLLAAALVRGYHGHKLKHLQRVQQAGRR